MKENWKKLIDSTDVEYTKSVNKGSNRVKPVRLKHPKELLFHLILIAILIGSLFLLHDIVNSHPYIEKTRLTVKAQTLARNTNVQPPQPAEKIEQVVSEAPMETPALAPPVEPEKPKIDYKAYIYQHESGNNAAAVNTESGACGIGQSWPCSKLPCTLQDYVCQDNWFSNYAVERYGSWEQAYYFWIANKYW